MITNLKTHRVHYTGKGVPQEGDINGVKNNDTFRDENTNTIYRYSTNGWIADTLNIFGNIKGDTGPQGVTGPVGPPGVAGVQGPIGSQGVKGDTGPQGPQGIPGSGGSGSITKIIATANGDIALPSPINHTGLIVIVNAKLFNLRLTGAIVNGIINPLVQQTTALISDNTQFIIIN